MIAAYQFNFKQKVYEVYFAGCRDHSCPGCHNPEAWSFDVGFNFDPQQFTRTVEFGRDAGVVEHVWLLGGEPLDRPLEDIMEVVNAVPAGIKIWLWTHYDLSKVPTVLLPKLYAVKTGPYYEGRDKKRILFPDDPKRYIDLASDNQEVYFL